MSTKRNSDLLSKQFQKLRQLHKLPPRATKSQILDSCIESKEKKPSTKLQRLRQLHELSPRATVNEILDACITSKEQSNKYEMIVDRILDPSS